MLGSRRLKNMEYIVREGVIDSYPFLLAEVMRCVPKKAEAKAVSLFPLFRITEIKEGGECYTLIEDAFSFNVKITLIRDDSCYPVKVWRDLMEAIRKEALKRVNSWMTVVSLSQTEPRIWTDEKLDVAKFGDGVTVNERHKIKWKVIGNEIELNMNDIREAFYKEIEAKKYRQKHTRVCK